MNKFILKNLSLKLTVAFIYYFITSFFPFITCINFYDKYQFSVILMETFNYSIYLFIYNLCIQCGPFDSGTLA